MGKLLLESADAFSEVAAQHRGELLAHCYRMLGTIEDAEDAVQEAFARGWQGRRTFRHSVSPRAWLYRIATNVCLDALESRKRGPRLSVGPFPDDLLTDDGGPEARYDARESISLAFVTVLNLLPPRQRAVLLLRDVLAFRAAEVAALLEMSVSAVNSAQQRARATLNGSYSPPPQASVSSDVLDRFVRAWEAADVAGLVVLLRADAVLAMPPMPSVAGAAQIGSFLAKSILPLGPMRLLEAHANRSPAYAAYMTERLGNRFVPFALLVIAGEGQHMARIDAFSDPRVFPRFGLPHELRV